MGDVLVVGLIVKIVFELGWWYFEKTLNEKLSIIVDKMIVESDHQETKNTLKNLKMTFNSFTSRLDFFVENLTRLAKDEITDQEKIGKLADLLNSQGKIISKEAIDVWGCHKFINETLKRLKVDANNAEYKSLQFLFNTDMYDLSCKIACVIGLFDSLINTDGKFDNRKFWDYINVLHNILWRKLQVVKKQE